MPPPEHDNTSGDGWGFATGVLLTGGVAVLHNNAKDEQHRREVAHLSELGDTYYQAWENVSLQLKDKTAEAERLRSENAGLKADKAHLLTEKTGLQVLVDSKNKYIDSLEHLAGPKLTASLFPPDQTQNGGNGNHPN